MTLNGNYHILAKFFERIGKLYRIINVNDFTVKTLVASRATTTSNTIQATCVATTFIYKEAEAVQKPSKRKGGKTAS
jgi:Tfp pilus assembly protein PilO